MIPSRVLSIVFLGVLASSLAFGETSELKNIVNTTATATVTPADTANCLNLYKPFPVVIPTETESLVTKIILQEFADYVDVQIIDEVYRRVRDAVCAKLVAAGIPCFINADTIAPCVRDTLTLQFKGVAIKDTSHDDIGSSLLIYEDIEDSGTVGPHPNGGPEYAGFVVNRKSVAGVAQNDTNQIDTSYLLVLPRNDGNVEDWSIPGNYSDPPTGGTGLGTVKPISELVTDGSGNLFWLDWDHRRRLIVDTIIADTLFGPGGVIKILAEQIDLKGDSIREISGKWRDAERALYIDWFEAPRNGNNFLELRPSATMIADWSLTFPDTGNRFEGGIWRYPNCTGCLPKWTPYDDQYVIWGVDTVRGTGAQIRKSIRISSGRHPAGREPIPGKDMPFLESRSFWPEVEWVIPHPDSTDVEPFFAWNNPPSDVPVGCPGPSDVRWHQLYVVSTYDADFHATGDPRYESDSTFLVNLPALGTTNDSMWVFRWKVTGQLAVWQGEG